MSGAEVGTYVRLLCRQWVEGSIPSDPRKLARLASEDYEVFLKIWETVSECFEPGDDGRLRNPRLEAQRRELNSFKAGQSERGKIGAALRWSRSRNGHPDTGAISLPSPKHGGHNVGAVAPLSPKHGDPSGGAIVLPLAKDSKANGVAIVSPLANYSSSSSTSSSIPETNVSGTLANASGAEDGAENRPWKLGSWLFGQAQAMKLVDEKDHDRVVRRNLADAKALLAKYPDDEIRTRANRMLKAIASGDLTKLPPTCHSLLTAWDYACVGPPLESRSLASSARSGSKPAPTREFFGSFSHDSAGPTPLARS